MKVHIDVVDGNETSASSDMPCYTIRAQKDIAGLGDRKNNLDFEDQLCGTTLFDQAGSKYLENDCSEISEKLCNGTAAESQSVISHCESDMLEISEDSCSVPENADLDHNDHFAPDIQQAHRIFQSFLLEKHKSMTAPFWVPVGDQDGNDMCLKKIEHKFSNRQYESITEFVADFRQMLENCYRFLGIDHWISKQAQKLETILEQKLTLLSRTLREKTALAVTSKGRFGAEDEKALVGTSTRRRTVPRNLAAISVCGSESIIVQALRLEEQQRAREEKRQRDLEKKEAGETSAKEVEEWECSLLSLAEPWSISTMWEIPAIGHFLCLAQTALNLPEIVFFELERCLLMPCCSSFLAKIMTSLLCPPHRRITLHRRPALPYRRWEAELRKKVLGWYQSIGRAKDQETCAEHLGLCQRFFWTLGESSPLEEKPFHLLPFAQRVWLLKGLCDNVYETQKDVQDAVLGQPIHECRESILGYDSQENTYIHFPHFCGADLRIYCQSPCLPLEFPLPSFSVKKLETDIMDRKEENLSSCPEFKSRRDRSDSSEDSQVDCKGHDNFQLHAEEELPSLPRLKLKEEDKKNANCEPCPEVGIKCRLSKFPSNSLSTNALEPPLPSGIGATVKKESSCQDGHPCPMCSVNSGPDPECYSCHCVTADSEKTASVVFRQPVHLKAKTIQCKKKRRKKKREKWLGIKARRGKLGLKKLRHARMANSTVSKIAADLKRKDKRKRQKLGRKLVQKNTEEKNQDHPPQLPVEPTFKLVCTSLDELRGLISRTEDELDELESTKKRCERWNIKKAAVKELHITLIRLLNELLPWEPKLLKAFHRNRARLKKESDDFKKHPEYENFVREEWVAFEGDGDACKEASSSTEISKKLKDEDKNERQLEVSGTTDSRSHVSAHPVSRLEHINTSLSESGQLTRSSKRRQSGGQDEDFRFSKKATMATDDSVNPEPETMGISRDQSIAGANALTTETISVVTAPVGGSHRRCNPIQALLAKSVGNKVTLISHPQVGVAERASQRPNKMVSASLTTTNPTAVCQPIPQPTPMQAHTPTTSSAQGPLQFSVQPVIHQKAGKKEVQQVIILPTNLLIQNTEEKRAQKSCSITSVAASKPATPVSSTPGLTASDSKIPVQQVSPLKNVSTVITSSAVSSSLPKSTPCGVSPARKKTADSSSTLKQPATSTSTTTDPNKCDQELKTVCIRASQSILVTTRGGNTGVVKVQTSENAAGILPSSPIFTLPPSFQAFLVSKATTVSTPTAQTTTTAKVLPDFSSLHNKAVSSNSAPQQPLKCSSPVKPSPSDLPLHVGPVSDNEAKSGQILIGINSLVPTNSQTNTSLPSSRWAVQTDLSENLIRLGQKRAQDSGTAPAQPTFQKVFVVTSTTNVSPPVSSITTTSAPSALSALKVRFMSPSGSACSTVTVAKGLVASQPNIAVTATSSEGIKVTGNLGQTTGTATEVQGINITGLASGIIDTTTVMSKKTASAPKVSPLIVSSGQMLVRTNTTAASSFSSLNINRPVNVTGSVDGKCVRLSTCDIGHMASSELLSAVQQKTVSLSVSNAISVSENLNNRSELVMSSSVPNIVSSILGSQINKGTTLPRSVLQDKPTDSICLNTAPTKVKLPIVSSTARISQPPALCTTTATPALENSCTATKSVMASTIKPSINAFPAATIPEKVVINTTAPLAPGTQLLINNTRFVVPAQGLAPGSHVLFISGPTVHPTGQLGPNHTYPTPRMAGILNPSSAVPVVQGLRMVAPGIQPQDTSVTKPTPSTAKTEQPIYINNVLTAVRPPTVSFHSTSRAQVSHIATGQSSGQQSLAHIVRLPSFLLPEVKDYSAASSSIVGSGPEKKVTVCAQSEICSPNNTTADILQTEPASAPLDVLTAAKPGIPWPSPIPPLSSTVSRIQTLPVATVPPVGSTISNCHAACVATVSPSVTTLLMATCQPVRPLKSENVRMTVTSHPPQVRGKPPSQVSGVQTIHTPGKLLVSPDGAILNVMRCPALENLPAMTDKAAMGLPGANKAALHRIDSQTKLSSNNQQN